MWIEKHFPNKYEDKDQAHEDLLIVSKHLITTESLEYQAFLDWILLIGHIFIYYFSIFFFNFTLCEIDYDFSL